MTKGMYVTGAFDFDEMLKMVKLTFEAGTKVAVIIHRNTKGKRIGYFQFTKGGAAEYFPESEEGEKFSNKFSELMRKHGDMPVIDVYDLPPHPPSS